MHFKKLEAPSLKALFVKDMADRIISGRLATGERLPTERELAEKMGVSRAVVNGGITELARCGFLEIAPRKGMFVADFRRRGTMETLPYILAYNGGKFDPQMLESLYEVRASIEKHIAVLAAERRTAEDVEELRQQLGVMAASKDSMAFGRATHDFYHILAVASKNIVYPLNIQAYRPIYVSLSAVLWKKMPRGDRLSRLNRLVDLIEQQDGDGAGACAAEIAVWGRSELAAAYSPGQSF